jgi:hypothetical protein
MCRPTQLDLKAILNVYIYFDGKIILMGRYCGMYAREVDVTRLRKRALLGNG